MNEVTTYSLGQPSEALRVAEILQKFVRDKNLTAKIQGKDFPLVEAWEFAGCQLGLIAVVTNILKIDSPDEIKYMCWAEVRKISDGSVVGLGIAICSNKEKLKRHFEEYAVIAMVQTRAISRAYRNVLGWVMKAAGFEATPEEETDILKDCPDEEEKDILRKLVANSTLTDDKKKEAYATIDGCKNYDLYQKIQYRLETMQKEFNDVENPNAKDINRKVREKVKADA
jgi:hypothetical protein